MWKFYISCLMASPLFANLDSLAFCSIQQQCLKKAPASCSEKFLKNPDVNYSLDYCDDLVLIKDWGVDLNDKNNQELVEVMGKQFRMEYPVDGLLPVNISMVRFLLGELPGTTQLVNAYQATEYTASYNSRDKSEFKANNGGSLRGNFKILHNDPEEDLWVIQGTGYAKVLKWSLKGDAVLTMDFDPLSNNQIAFDIKCMAFPGNSMINGIMELDFFEDKVLEFINKIVSDIMGSAERFADGDRALINQYPYFQTPDGKAFLERFQKVIVESQYE